MISLKTSDILETLNDFLTPPIYEGRGRWASIMDVLRSVKTQQLSGIFLLKSSESQVFNFVDYGRIIGSVAFEGGSMFMYDDDDFFREKSGMKHIRPFRYRFSPLNSDVVMVVSAFHRSSIVMDTITPFPEKTVNELMSFEFSGILRCYSPLSFSAVFFEGMLSGVFSGGEVFNLSDLLKAEGGLYEFKVFSVKEQLYEKSYAQLFNILYEELRHIYARVSRNVPDLYIKVRREMLERSYSDQLLDPIIGLVEPMENDVLFHISGRKGLYVFESFLEALSETIRGETSLPSATVKKVLDDIERLKKKLREGQ